MFNSIKKSFKSEFECLWCLESLNKDDFRCCVRKGCDLQRLCSKCYLIHKEIHLAKEFPVSNLINNMISNKNNPKIIGDYRY